MIFECCTEEEGGGALFNSPGGFEVGVCSDLMTEVTFGFESALATEEECAAAGGGGAAEAGADEDEGVEDGILKSDERSFRESTFGAIELEDVEDDGPFDVFAEATRSSGLLFEGGSGSCLLLLLESDWERIGMPDVSGVSIFDASDLTLDEKEWLLVVVVEDGSLFGFAVSTDGCESLFEGSESLKSTDGFALLLCVDDKEDEEAILGFLVGDSSGLDGMS